MNGFTARHFELLDRWKGRKLDRSDPEQEQAYEELREAYSVTEAWAQEVKERLFPSGSVKVVKKPTNQAQKFDAYHWARIYPEKHSPDYLAECIDSGCALLEFGGDIDWSDARYDDRDAVRQRWRQDKNPDATAYDTDVQAIWRFRVEMRRGDIVVASDGYRRFRAVGEVTGDYEFQRREDGFHHRRAVRWHWHVRDREGDPGSVFLRDGFTGAPSI